MSFSNWLSILKWRKRHGPEHAKNGRAKIEEDLAKLVRKLKEHTKKATGIKMELTPAELRKEFKARRFPKELSSRILRVLELWEGMTYKGEAPPEPRRKKAVEEAQRLLVQLERRSRQRN